MSLAAPAARVPRGAIAAALFVVVIAALPIALIAEGWERMDARRAVVLEPAKGRLLLRTYGRNVATALAPTPPECAYFAVFVLLLTPVAALAAAARPGDKDGGRLRAARDMAVVAGVATSLLAVLYALSAGWLAVTGSAAARALLATWMPRLWLVSALYALPYVTLAAAMRGVCRATSTAAAAYSAAAFSFVVAHALLRLQGSRLAEWLPPAVDGLLLSGAKSALRGAAVAACWTAVFCAVRVFCGPVEKEEEAR